MTLGSFRAPGASLPWLHHAAHAAHAAIAPPADGHLLALDLADDRLGREDVLRDRGRVLRRRARDHRRVDDAGGDESVGLVRRGVQAPALLGLADVVDDDGALEA